MSDESQYLDGRATTPDGAVPWAIIGRRGAATGHPAVSAAVALGLFLAALVLRLEIEAWPGAPFATFVPAVAATAWLCGAVPGLAVTLASAVAAWWLLHVPGIPTLPPPADTRALLGFVAVAMLMVALASRAGSSRAAAASFGAPEPHRTASILQLVSSVVAVRGRAVVDPAARHAIAAAQRRLELLATLERQSAGGQIRHDALAAVMRTACERALAESPGVHALVVAPDTGQLDFHRAAVLLLLHIELVENAARHAFADRTAGLISVRLQRERPGTLRLDIRDDGAGLPPGLDLLTAGTAGARIVRSLTQSLNGQLRVTGSTGTIIQITFPAALADQNEAGAWVQPLP